LAVSTGGCGWVAFYEYLAFVDFTPPCPKLTFQGLLIKNNKSFNFLLGKLK
jgi:hypothetical protein